MNTRTPMVYIVNFNSHNKLVKAIRSIFSAFVTLYTPKNLRCQKSMGLDGLDEHEGPN